MFQKTAPKSDNGERHERRAQNKFMISMEKTKSADGFWINIEQMTHFMKGAWTLLTMPITFQYVKSNELLDVKQFLSYNAVESSPHQHKHQSPEASATPV